MKPLGACAAASVSLAIILAKLQTLRLQWNYETALIHYRFLFWGVVVAIFFMLVSVLWWRVFTGRINLAIQLSQVNAVILTAHVMAFGFYIIMHPGEDARMVIFFGSILYLLPALIAGNGAYFLTIVTAKVAVMLQERSR